MTTGAPCRGAARGGQGADLDRCGPWVVGRADHECGTTVTRRTHHAAELGVARLGHHGLLRRGVGEAAWPPLASWLPAPRRAHIARSFVG